MIKPTIPFAPSEVARLCAFMAIGALPFWSPAHAQVDNDGQFVLEEIIVTAQKREQALKDVPLSLTAISSKDLLERSLFEMEEALAVVPNLNVTANLSSNINIAIRGVNTSVNNLGLEAGVGMQVDGVPLGRPSYMNTALIDVERIEVLRGPQGTLYGKNTTGGLINVVSRKPRKEFAASADLTLGEYDLRQFRGYITGGFNETGTVSGRLAATVVKRDGWAEDRNPANDDFQGQDFHGVRGHLLFEPSDKFRLLLTGFFSEDDAIENFQDIQSGPLFALDGSDGWDRSIENNENNFFEREINGVSASWDYRFDNGITFTSVTGFLQNDWENLNDQDYSMLDILATNRREEQEQISQEFRLTSDDDGLFTWVAGLYYFDQSQSGVDRATLGEDTPPLLGVPFPVPGYEEAVNTISAIDVESIAGFVAGSWSLSERWTLAGGLRFTREEKDLTYTQAIELFELAPGVPLGIVLALAQPVAPVQQSISDSEPSGDLSLTFAATENVNIYGRVARGFKAGGFDSTVSGVADPGDLTFSPEFVNSVEVGVKSLIADNRVQFNVAAFYLDWSDKQEQEFNGTVFVTGNAASASNQGVELELTALLTERLRLTGSLGFQDATYDTFIIDNPADPANPDVRSGNKLPFAPDTSGMLALDYSGDIGNWGVFLRGEAVYRDSNFTGSDNDPRLEQASRTDVNARIGISSPNDRFSIAVWGKNLTEEDYVLGGFEFFGTTYASVSSPSMYGVELRANF